MVTGRKIRIRIRIRIRRRTAKTIVFPYRGILTRLQLAKANSKGFPQPKVAITGN